MMVTTCDMSLRQRERTNLTDTTMLRIATASPRSPPTSPIVPTLRTSNQLASPSTIVSKTHASGFAATPLPSRCQGIQLYQDALLPGCLGICASHMAQEPQAELHRLLGGSQEGLDRQLSWIHDPSRYSS
jgi:hypothetical protein